MSTHIPLKLCHVISYTCPNLRKNNTGKTCPNTEAEPTNHYSADKFSLYRACGATENFYWYDRSPENSSMTEYKQRKEYPV